MVREYQPPRSHRIFNHHQPQPNAASSSKVSASVHFYKAGIAHLNTKATGPGAKLLAKTAVTFAEGTKNLYEGLKTLSRCVKSSLNAVQPEAEYNLIFAVGARKNNLKLPLLFWICIISHQ
jgi:hypothetical protein